MNPRIKDYLIAITIVLFVWFTMTTITYYQVPKVHTWLQAMFYISVIGPIGVLFCYLAFCAVVVYKINKAPKE
jgi:hypothetical protein